METRAHFIVVGAFIIASFALGFAFIIWGVSSNADSDDVPYDILFMNRRQRPVYFQSGTL